MNKSLVHDFLLECILPGFRGVKEQKSEDKLLDLIIDRAHRDVMVGARYKVNNYCIWYCEHNGDYKSKLKELIKRDVKALSGRKLINELLSGDKNINVGLIQKLVNMTVKYLYVLDSFGYLGYVGFNVTFSDECDCPLDSRILERISGKVNKKYTAWTKMNDIKEYEEVQSIIKDEVVKQSGKRNLEYDFYYWEKDDSGIRNSISLLL